MAKQPKNDEPTQATPQGATIPIPTKADVFRDLEKVAKGDDTVAQAMQAVSAFHAQKVHCKDVYGGECNMMIGPPNWDHRVNRHAEPPHPTPEQALRAAANPNTLAAVLRRLGDWDPELYGAVRVAARANPSYPG